MKFSFELLVNSPPDKIWELYADVNKWVEWDFKLKSVTLEGEFSIGSTGIIEVENQAPIAYEIVDIKENLSFCTKTIISSFGEIYFNHEITESYNRCTVNHSIELKNGKTNEQSIHFLKQLFNDVPIAIFSIKELVEN